MFATVATMPERRVTEPSGPASRSAMYAVAVATAAPRATPVSSARHEQAGERHPRDEDQCRDAREDECRDQHGTPAVPVGHVPGEQEARDDPGRVDRVDDGDGQRRQLLLLLVEPVERARSGGQGRQGEERERDRPEGGAPRQSRNRGDACSQVCASTPKRWVRGDGVHAVSVRHGARIAPGYCPGQAGCVARGRDFARQGVAQGPARADAELGEHLLQVPLDGAGAEEELGADLGVRPAVAGELGDVLLLGGELVAGVVAALADLLAGGQQLVPRTLGESLRAHREQRLARDPQLLARIDAPALTAQPLPVEQARACELDADARAGEAIDRLAVQALGGVSLAREGAHAGADSQRPIGRHPATVRSDIHSTVACSSAVSPVLDAASATSGTTNGVKPRWSCSKARLTASCAAS